MDNPFLVSRFKPLGDLNEKRDGLIGGDRSLYNPLRQGLTSHQLHDEKQLPIVFFETIEA